MILERCRQFHISLNLKKCIFCAPFGILLGHVVYREGLLMEPIDISIIGYLPPPSSVQQLSYLPPSSLVQQLRTTLGHISYYKKFITGYVEVSAPMEKLLEKYVKFQWNE